jgi:hypothetical protein
MHLIIQIPAVEIGSFFDGTDPDSWFSGFLDSKPQSVSVAPVIESHYPSEFRHDCSVDIESIEEDEEYELSEDMKNILPDGIDKDMKQILPDGIERDAKKISLEWIDKNLDFASSAEIKEKADQVSQFLLSTASEITIGKTAPAKKSVQFKVSTPSSKLK